MKKLIALLLIVNVVNAYVFTTNSIGQTEGLNWKSANQGTIYWDATEALIDGSPAPSDGSIKYRIWLKKEGADDSTKVEVGLTDKLEFTITFTEEGRFVVGVQAIRYDANGVEMDAASSINWSDVNGESTPNPFGFVHIIPAATPLNLR